MCVGVAKYLSVRLFFLEIAKESRTKMHICVSPSMKDGLWHFSKNRENDENMKKIIFFRNDHIYRGE
jgi:hypothetical protein